MTAFDTSTKCLLCCLLNATIDPCVIKDKYEYHNPIMGDDL